MRGVGPGAETAAGVGVGETDRVSPDAPSPRDAARPTVVIWEADGSPYGRHGYGGAISTRLAAAGIASATVPLTVRRPSPEELAAPVHVLSGGTTPATSNRDWVRSARRDLEPVLARAVAGDATVTGICFGAQLIAATLAGPGAVGPNPRGMEAGLTVVRPLDTMAGVVEGSGVVASQLHHHVIEPAAVAALGGEILLTNDQTAVQAYALGSTVVGLQFHPELDPAATRATVRRHRRTIRKHRGSPARSLASIDQLGDGWRAEIFDRFVVRPARPLAAPPVGALDAASPAA